MPEFWYVVIVNADTQDLADRVIVERVGYDEDLGFDYTIGLMETPLKEDDF